MFWELFLLSSINTTNGGLFKLNFDKYSRCIFEMQGKVLKLAFALQKALETVNNVMAYLYTIKIRLTCYFLNCIIQKGSHSLKYLSLRNCYSTTGLYTW